MTDEQGVGNINASKAIVNLTLGPRDVAQFRYNISDDGTSEFGTCGNYTAAGPGGEAARVVINCTVLMKFYDNASSNWVINVSVKDIDGLTGINDTVTFTYNSLAAFSINSRGVSDGANLNFSTNVFAGSNDVAANAPILLNNTGNNDFDQINITGANLIQIGGAAEIAIGRFFVNITNNTLGNGMPLTTSAQTIRAAITLAGEEISNATLMHGPSSIGETPIYPGVADFYSKGNQTLLFWLDLPLGLPSGTYNNTWNLTVVDLG